MVIGAAASRLVACYVTAALQSACARLQLKRDRERGQGMVEYALILILIAVVVVLVVGVVGKQIHNIFSNVSSGLAT